MLAWTRFVGVVCLGACGLDTFGISDDPSDPATSTGTTGVTTHDTTGAPTSSTGDPPGTSTTTPSDGSTTTPAPICGDGVSEPPEECDDGNQEDADYCTNACRLPACGDGVKSPGEGCDDGNPRDGDECSNACVLTTCGNGVVEPMEDCDDLGESTVCNANCTQSHCGDTIVNAASGEGCDDGNTLGSDACSPICEPTVLEQVVLGQSHMCVLLTGGRVKCWGFGEYGALGYEDDVGYWDEDGEVLDLGDDAFELPRPDVNVGGGVTRIDAGANHTCALLDTMKMRCWGFGGFGRLGYGNVSNLGAMPDDMPPPYVAVDAAVLAIAAGGVHTCARLPGDLLRCWGFGNDGALGTEDAPATHLSPGENAIDIDSVQEVSLGWYHTCVRQPRGVVRCWGRNDHGQLGLGHIMSVGYKPDDMPPAPVDLGGPATQLASGNYHTCVLMMEAGKVRCWGFGANGRLGTGTNMNVGDGVGLMPADVSVDLGGAATQVVVGSGHSCALVDAKVQCWGSGKNGQLGNGTIADSSSPVAVELGDVEVRSIHAHFGGSTCAVLIDGSLRCWGLNDHGQLGLGHTDPIGDDEFPGELVARVPF